MAQQYIVNGGPETSGVVHLMVCEGGTWKSILSANALAEVTKIGNQTCANGDYFTYDGTKFICTTGSGVSGAIDDLTDAYADYVTTNNLIMGRPGAAALTAGAVSNTFIGDLAGATTANSTATTDYNTAVGYLALSALTSGKENSAFGESALRANTTGGENAAFGSNALNDNLSGYSNTAFGDEALWTNVGKFESTAIGYRAMRYADSTATNGTTYNTAVGAYALRGSATPANNTGDSNTAIGHSALVSITSGYSNTALGRDALFSTTSGTSNTAIGRATLANNETGQSNVAVGYGVLMSNTASHANTGVGAGALVITTGGRNTALGADAGDGITTGTDNILIGYNTDTPANNTNNHLNIGNTIYGDLQNDRIRIGGSGTVGAGPLIAHPPASEAIAGAATITANACGTVKQITSTGNQTTNTTDTFTAPTASYAGCCMDVVNVDTVATITLDQNGKFFTGSGADVALAPGKGVRVCSDGTSWYQAGGVSSASGGSAALSGLTVATGTNAIDNTNYAQEWQWSTLAGATGLKLSSTSTAAASNAQKMFEVALSGANGTAAQTTYGAHIINVHTGTTSTNVGLFVGASGGASGNVPVWARTGGGTNATVLEALRIENEDTNSAGTDGIGSALTFWNETETAGTFNEAARIAGVFEDAANGSRDGQLRFYVAGPNGAGGAASGETMRITSAGNVGIGTTNPGARVHVYESGNIPGRLQIEGPTSDQRSSELLLVTSGDSSTVLRGGGAMRGWSLEGVGQSNATTAHRNDFNIAYYDGSAWNFYFWIDNAGSVGIGTDTPQSTLHVPDGNYAQFEDNNAGAPPGADCDANAERGRMSIDTTNNRLYICNGATRGWDYVALTD